MAQSIRVSNRLYEEALTASAASCRSLAQQIEHWARLGQMVQVEVEHGSMLLEDAIKRQHQRDAAQVKSGQLDAKALFLFTTELAKKTTVTEKSIDYDQLWKDYA